MVVMVEGEKRPPNMIGSFPLADGKGSKVAEAVVKKAKEWKVGVEEGEAKPCLGCNSQQLG